MQRESKVNHSENKRFKEDDYFDLRRKLKDLIAERNYDEALICCNQLIYMAPNFIETKFERGYILSRLGRCREAAKYFKDVIVWWEGDAFVFMHLALCNYETGNIVVAVEYCNKALEKKPCALAWYIKGCCFEKLGNNNKAAFYFDKASEVNPKFEIDGQAPYGFEYLWELLSRNLYE